MVHVHSDQVGVVIIHPKAVKTNLSSCWSGQQNRQLSPETTGTFVLTRQDHIWRGLKAQKSNWLLWLSERTCSFVFLESLDQIPTEIKLWHFLLCKNWWGGRCLWIASHEFAARRWAWDLEPWIWWNLRIYGQFSKKWCDFQTDKLSVVCFHHFLGKTIPVVK